MARLKELSGNERDKREKYYIEIMNDYSANNMEKLRKLINHSIKRFGKNQDNEDYDEFLSMANMQLWKILLSFDPEKNDNIQMYIKAKMCLKMRQTLILFIKVKNGRMHLQSLRNIRKNTKNWLLMQKKICIHGRNLYQWEWLLVELEIIQLALFLSM